MFKKNFFNRASLDFLQIAESASVATILGRMVSAKEESASIIARKMDDPAVFFGDMENRKKQLSSMIYAKGVRILGKMALRLNPDFFNIGIVSTFRINLNTLRKSNIDNIINIFGGYEIKEKIAQAVINSLQYIEEEIQNLVGVDLFDDLALRLKHYGPGWRTENLQAVLAGVNMYNFPN